MGANKATRELYQKLLRVFTDKELEEDIEFTINLISSETDVEILENQRDKLLAALLEFYQRRYNEPK